MLQVFSEIEDDQTSVRFDQIMQAIQFPGDMYSEGSLLFHDISMAISPYQIHQYSKQ